jgi:hypothetical protein
VNLGSDVPTVAVGADAIPPGSYLCRFDQGAAITCAVSLAGGSAELPEYRLRGTGPERILDGTLRRVGGASYRFEGRLRSTLDGTQVATTSGELTADAAGRTLRGTLTNLHTPGELGPSSQLLELRR